MRFTKIQKHFV